MESRRRKKEKLVPLFSPLPPPVPAWFTRVKAGRAENGKNFRPFFHLHARSLRIAQNKRKTFSVFVKEAEKNQLL